MTDKKLHFPSMDEEGGESSNLYYQNDSGEYEPYKPPSWGDEWDDLLDDDADDGETGGDRSSGSTHDGEMEAYNRVKDLLGSEEDSFHYFPDDAMEENNQLFSMSRLQKSWASETKRNIGIANFFYKNFLEENLRKEAEHTGIASHYLLVQGFYKAAKHAEQLAMKQMRGESETRTMRFKGMNRIMAQKMEELCRELASRTYSDAKAKIIELHGGISHS
jgi:hypothetical protein